MFQCQQKGWWSEKLNSLHLPFAILFAMTCFGFNDSMPPSWHGLHKFGPKPNNPCYPTMTWQWQCPKELGSLFWCSLHPPQRCKPEEIGVVLLLSQGLVSLVQVSNSRVTHPQSPTTLFHCRFNTLWCHSLSCSSTYIHPSISRPCFQWSTVKCWYRLSQPTQCI